VCGADSQGAIGYALQQNLHNVFREAGLHREVATIVTQTEVAANDPAFSNPTKPIGSFMNAEQAEQRRAQGWNLIEDSNRGWRRVVASPKPLRIVELPVIRRLVDEGVVVITAGGGGIPVVAGPGGDLKGVAAVIDKDLASALLANALGADLLLISTAVERVALSFGTPDQRWLDHLTLSEAKHYQAAGGHFAGGSMGPKIQAVINYLERGGTEAIITNPESIGHALQGTAGTRVTPS
jgi:carbamate kinase